MGWKAELIKSHMFALISAMLHKWKRNHCLMANHYLNISSLCGYNLSGCCV